jgi:dTDP-4-amino-4,6-dideoxygalactose transaminase
MTWKFPLADIDFGSEEIAKVQNVLESRWLTMGSVTQAFEQAAADYLGVKHAIAVTNATAGLHLACCAVGITEGDEVIVPSLTFVATSNAVLYTRGIPVFADITSMKDLDISPTSIEAQVNENTKALMVMHYGGYACDMETISPIAKKYGLHIIEDAAHAIGSELDGHMLGTIGEVGVYSFFSNKNMTTGEGGMVVTNDDEIAKKVRLMRSHGMTSLTWDRHQGHAWDYDVVDLGYNYRIDEMRAALGIVQLAKLDKNNQRRRELTSVYQELIKERIPEIVVPFVEHRGQTAAHIMPVMLPKGANRARFMEGMKAREIQTSHHYPPIHRFTAYANNPLIKKEELPVTDEAAEREVTLPLSPGLKDEDVEVIVQAVLESLD